MPYKCSTCGRSHKTGQICPVPIFKIKGDTDSHIKDLMAYSKVGINLKEGVKYDRGKPQYSLLPGHALEELVKVYTFGATKYEANNWRKGMLWSRTFSAIMRHCWSFWRGETYDQETKLHHLAHAAFGCLTLVEYTMKRTKTDDRPSTMIRKEK